MSTIDTELLDIALEALAKNKVRVEDLARGLSASSTKLNSHVDEYESNKSLVKEDIAKAVLDNKIKLQEAIDSLPIPNDGYDGKDGSNGVDGKDGIDGKEGKPGPQGPMGLPGKDGKNGRDGKDGKDADTKKLEKYIKDTIASLEKNEPKETPKVEDVILKDGKLTIKYCEGKDKILTLPKSDLATHQFSGGSPTIGSDITKSTVQKWLGELGITGDGDKSITINSSSNVSGTYGIVFIDASTDIDVTLSAVDDDTVINLKRIDGSNAIVTIIGTIDNETNPTISSMENYKLIAKNPQWYML